MRLAATAFAVVLLFVARLPGQTPAASNAQDGGTRETVEFNRDIRPLLSDRCYTCHGPDQARRRTKLRFDVEVDAKQDLGGRFAIVPGDVAKSEIIRRITAADPAKRMPPVSSGRTLTTGEIDLIQRWIEQGAKWEKHWSFNPPRRAPLPEISNRAWPRNEIDFFVVEEARTGRPRSGAGSGSGQPDSSRQPRLDRPAADTCRSRCVRERQIA